jgi:antitoxin MazE
VTLTLQVSRWGNSLAVRLPADLARQVGLREGDSVEARLTVDGTLALRPSGWNRRAFASELAAARDALPVSAPVVEGLRSDARY